MTEKKSFYVASFPTEAPEELSEIIEVSGPGNEDTFRTHWYGACAGAREKYPQEWQVADIFKILEEAGWTLKSVPYTEVTF